SSNAVDVRLLERFEYLENLNVRGRDTKNTLTANCIFLPQRRLHTAQESYKRFAHFVPKVQITSMLPIVGFGSEGNALQRCAVLHPTVDFRNLSNHCLGHLRRWLVGIEDEPAKNNSIGNSCLLVWGHETF